MRFMDLGILQGLSYEDGGTDIPGFWKSQMLMALLVLLPATMSVLWSRIRFLFLG